MLNSKDRAALRAAANGLQPYFQIGKGGINENMAADVAAALEAHELVKINVLKTAGETPRRLMAELAAAVGAEEVAAIGGKIILYKKSSRENFDHILK